MRENALVKHTGGLRGVASAEIQDAVVGSVRKVPMAESITIPAHIENGSLRLDAPLPPNVERVEVLAHLKPQAGAATGLDLIAFLDALPAGKRTRAELDARLDAERKSWPD